MLHEMLGWFAVTYSDKKKRKTGISRMPGIYVKRLLLRVVNYADISKSCSLGFYFY